MLDSSYAIKTTWICKLQKLHPVGVPVPGDVVAGPLNLCVLSPFVKPCPGKVYVYNS